MPATAANATRTGLACGAGGSSRPPRRPARRRPGPAGRIPGHQRGTPGAPLPSASPAGPLASHGARVPGGPGRRDRRRGGSLALILVQDGRGQPDRHITTAARRMHPGRPAAQPVLAAFPQGQRRLPRGERRPDQRRGRQGVDVADEHRSGGADRPRYPRQVLVGVQDRGQLGGGPPLPPCPLAVTNQRAGHKVTSRPVSQPAFSSAARASSAVRCPYVAYVVVTDECPRSLATTSTGTPSRSHLVAAV